MKSYLIFIGIIPILCLATSCNSSGFGGKSSSNPDTVAVEPGGSENGTDGEDLAANPENMDCVNGDKAEVAFPEPINSCIQEGKLFDFAGNSCLPVVAANFSCSFDEMAAAVDGIGVRSQSIVDARDNGALLVSCGEKNEGNTIVAQWFYPADGVDICAPSANISQRIVTACYKLYNAGELPPNETDEDRKAILRSCLYD